jgi:toxin ParE1/3/4
MGKVFFTNKAVEDLTKIWEYTVETWSEKQADRYYGYLVDSCVEITRRPAIGKQYQEIGEDILGFRASKHIIFYRITPSGDIEILRILHGNMDLKSRIGE